MAITGTGDLIRAAPVWPGQRPFLIHYWGWRPTGIGQNDPVELYETLEAEEWRLRVNNGSAAFHSVDDGAVASANIAIEPPDEEWYSHAGTAETSTRRTVFAYGNGTAEVNTASSSPATPTDTLITPPLSGAIAEISFWDTAGFNATNYSDLYLLLASGGTGGNGANPLDINEQAAEPWTGQLVAYIRASTIADICDLSGNGNDFNISGTLSNFGSHPPVDSRPDSCPGVSNLLLLLNARER